MNDSINRYIDPPEDVTKGRKLNALWKHELLMLQLQIGEHLYAYIDRYIFKQARLVDDVKEFEDVDAQYRGGYVNVLGYYAVSIPEPSTATTLSDEPLPNEPKPAPPEGG